MIQHIDYTNANADVFAFDRGEGVKEYHAIMHVTDCRLTFHAQLDALMNAYQQLIEGELKGTVAVFKRYFLSDAANQADEVAVADPRVLVELAEDHSVVLVNHLAAKVAAVNVGSLCPDRKRHQAKQQGCNNHVRIHVYK